jgi:site-specific recombinase XerD
VPFEPVEPVIVAGYVEELGRSKAAPTAKQSLAAIRVLFDWMVVGQVLPMNPAASVREPRHVVKRGKTPVLSADQARQILDSIDTSAVAVPVPAPRFSQHRVRRLFHGQSDGLLTAHDATTWGRCRGLRSRFDPLHIRQFYLKKSANVA